MEPKIPAYPYFTKDKSTIFSDEEIKNMGTDELIWRYEHVLKMKEYLPSTRSKKLIDKLKREEVETYLAAIEGKIPKDYKYVNEKTLYTLHHTRLKDLDKTYSDMRKELKAKRINMQGAKNNPDS